MKCIDLNVDIGEGAGFDEALLAVATSANVGLGAHAGSWEETLATLALCRARGVRIGAHPGFPDPEYYGRRGPTDDEWPEWRESVIQQVCSLLTVCRPDYLKPHGALYNATARARVGSALADLLVEILRRADVPLMGQPALRPGGPAHAAIAEQAGVGFWREGFADRGYEARGFLIPRGEPGAILTEPDDIRRQVEWLAPQVDSICLHGDTPGCVAFAELVRSTLVDLGYEVRSP